MINTFHVLACVGLTVYIDLSINVRVNKGKAVPLQAWSPQSVPGS